MRWLHVFLILAACSAPRAKPSSDKCTEPTELSVPVPALLRAEGKYFKDPQGRVVLLRGVNLAGDSKLPPYATVTSETMLDPLPGWGINTVRLLFTWEAFEPQPCEYDEAYLAYYERVTEWAAARGIYVIIDFHQDAYSRFSIDGCGEGFPAWSVLSSIPLRTPDNGHACEAWGVKMVFDSAHLDTWTAFHRDSEGARTRFLAMVSRVATRMSAHPNVIGYDVINEPWGQPYELNALFEDLGAVIRAQDPDTILFIPPHAIGSAGGPNDIPRVTHDNISHSPHYYDATIVILKAWGGTKPDAVLDGMLRASNAWDAPMLLGEFGAGVTTRDSANYIEAFYAWLDARFVSATQWNYTPAWTPERKDGWNTEDFSITGLNQTVRPELFKPRAYPQKTAGVPLSFKRSTKGFTYRWMNDPSLGATEIFVLDEQNVSAVVGVECVRSAHLLSCTGGAGEVSVSAD